jgi:hypothetical protein
MRIIIRTYNEKQGIITILQRTTIDRNRMYLGVLLVAKNREWRTGIIFWSVYSWLFYACFVLVPPYSQYEGMNQKLLPQKIRLFSKLAPSLVFRNVKLQYRYLIYPKHVFYNYCNMIFIIFAFTNICTLEKYLYLLLYFHPVFIPVFATLFYILQKALAFPRKIFILLQVL